MLATTTGITRRELLLGTGAVLAGCRIGPPGNTGDDALDRVLAVHSGLPPEVLAAGADHYPMAAEALLALGRADAIPGQWAHTSRPSVAAVAVATAEPPVLGDGHFPAWRAWFERELAVQDWAAVVSHWVPRLSPGLAGACCHGLIRTGHAVRAIRQHHTAPRVAELAAGLAYWAGSFTELPVADADEDDFLRLLASTPRLRPDTDVPFAAVTPALIHRPLAPPLASMVPTHDPRSALIATVQAASTAFLAMLAQERHRIWLLHTVTAPAAAELLLPALAAADACLLVGCVRQAVVALQRAFGAPFVPESPRAPDEPWPVLVQRAVNSGSVHTIKLIEALQRCDPGLGPLPRAVAERWLAWR